MRKHDIILEDLDSNPFYIPLNLSENIHFPLELFDIYKNE